MIVQEDVPYTKEEVKAMVKTIHDLREKLSLLGWHPASELPPLDEDGDSECVVGIWEEQQFSPFITIPLPVAGYVSYEDGAWTKPIKWWCYPPEKED